MNVLKTKSVHPWDMFDWMYAERLRDLVAKKYSIEQMIRIYANRETRFEEYQAMYDYFCECVDQADKEV